MGSNILYSESLSMSKDVLSVFLINFSILLDFLGDCKEEVVSIGGGKKIFYVTSFLISDFMIESYYSIDSAFTLLSLPIQFN